MAPAVVKAALGPRWNGGCRRPDALGWAAALAVAVLALMATAALAPAPASAADVPTTVLVTPLEGPVTPVIADHISSALAVAAQDGHAALVIEMDTPGGLDTAMRSIVQELLASSVPVIVHVSPQGARAASAGAVIAYAAHVLVMAPATNIGAATPLDLQGGEVLDKIVEDAAAYVRAVAEARGRDVDFAVDMVRTGRSVPATEAVAIGAADLVVADRAGLLRAIDGRTVIMAGGDEVRLRTAQVSAVEYSMSPVRRVLQLLADPNLAFLFLSLGALAVLYELANPGVGLGGTIGAIFLILGFFALAVLPTTTAGVALLILAGALFVAELFAPGIGALAGGGTIALLVGGLLLFDRPAGIAISLGVLLPVVAAVGLGAILVARLAFTTRRAPPVEGAGGSLVGCRGKVRSAEGDRVQVFVEGALWKAHSTAGPLDVGDPVRVVEMHGLELLVEPAPDQ